jgi:hypothetical protein
MASRPVAIRRGSILAPQLRYPRPCFPSPYCRRTRSPSATASSRRNGISKLSCTASGLARPRSKWSSEARREPRIRGRSPPSFIFGSISGLHDGRVAAERRRAHLVVRLARVSRGSVLHRRGFTPHTSARVWELFTGRFAVAIALLAALVPGPGSAKTAVRVTVDKSHQRMTVSVDGIPRYSWADLKETSRLRHPERNLSPAAPGAQMVLKRILQLADAAFHLLSRRLRVALTFGSPRPERRDTRSPGCRKVTMSCYLHEAGTGATAPSTSAVRVTSDASVARSASPVMTLAVL